METLKVIAGIIALVLGVYLFARCIIINISMYFARIKATKAPTEANAWKVYTLLKKRCGVSINNHPKDWAKYRDMFYKINGSAEVPSELKQNIKDRLIKKGLYINNMKIVDNYKNVKQDA